MARSRRGLRSIQALTAVGTAVIPTRRRLHSMAQPVPRPERDLPSLVVHVHEGDLRAVLSGPHYRRFASLADSPEEITRPALWFVVARQTFLYQRLYSKHSPMGDLNTDEHRHAIHHAAQVSLAISSWPCPDNRNRVIYPLGKGRGLLPVTMEFSVIIDAPGNAIQQFSASGVPVSAHGSPEEREAGLLPLRLQR